MAVKAKIWKNSAPTNADLEYILTMRDHGHTSPEG